MIKIQQLNFHYDVRQVLYDINLQLDVGSITGLIGPNGAGKSTLMRCMAGLENPSSGTVLLNGKPILDNPRASFAQLGYLPDLFGLPEDLTVLQCLTYAAKARGVSDEMMHEAVVGTVEKLGLRDKIHHKVSALSRGQKQRVGIGQVIVHQPKFLLLDEPASGLDPEARHELSLLLLDLKASGMTILVSSHILSELDEYCTHMLVIRDGRIQAHQALHDDNPNQQTVLLRFFRLPENGLAQIQAIDWVQNVQEKDGCIWVKLAQGEAERVALLRELVARDLPVCEMQPVKTTLLQSYQNSLNIHKGEV
ncbi:ABC transporter ATP-binding protein [Wielerella bovis]|uniref:ABC transporter ATP-binding protein n=1 Tax=Wielerella bovis TaxID=2917790 RepID=UPI002018F523|nr:ABC transporter ATP-binding protein [Wielerella bovis]ULJ59299.1 ABC transporter ATP-binding protein [Wielerella bovis]